MPRGNPYHVKSGEYGGQFTSGRGMTTAGDLANKLKKEKSLAPGDAEFVAGYDKAQKLAAARKKKWDAAHTPEEIAERDRVNNAFENGLRSGAGLVSKAPNEGAGIMREGTPVSIVGNVAGKGKRGTVMQVAPSGSFFGVEDANGKFLGYFHESDLKLTRTLKASSSNLYKKTRSKGV